MFTQNPCHLPSPSLSLWFNLHHLLSFIGLVLEPIKGVHQGARTLHCLGQVGALLVADEGVSQQIPPPEFGLRPECAGDVPRL